jgi:hypothetical protein
VGAASGLLRPAGARAAAHHADRRPAGPAIAVGVRRGDAALLARIDAALQRRHADIERILDDYAVPRIEETPR